MKAHGMFHRRLYHLVSAALTTGCFFVLLFTPIYPQRIAMVTPEQNGHSEGLLAGIFEKFQPQSAKGIRLIDVDLAEAAFRSISIDKPFNMTLADAKRATSAVGCDFLVLVRSGSQRRTSLTKGEYLESYAAFYLVSGRTGRLVEWLLRSFEAESAETADKRLLESMPEVIQGIVDKVRITTTSEIYESRTPEIESLIEENSPESKAIRPPAPYRRIKPKYSETAFLYDVRATVDIEADINVDGNILRTEIVRWAGFGLDESVTEAVTKMNWRPAERRGRPLPMRILLRYNFTKVED